MADTTTNAPGNDDLPPHVQKLLDAVMGKSLSYRIAATTSIVVASHAKNQVFDTEELTNFITKAFAAYREAVLEKFVEFLVTTSMKHGRDSVSVTSLAVLGLKIATDCESYHAEFTEWIKRYCDKLEAEEKAEGAEK